MENNLVLIVAIVNNGYAEDLVELAKSKGAKGATIINGTGSVRPEAEKLYGITIHPEKEIIFLTVIEKISSRILKSIYESFGSTSLAQGVAFTLPISYATSNLESQYLTKEND